MDIGSIKIEDPEIEDLYLNVMSLLNQSLVNNDENIINDTCLQAEIGTHGSSLNKINSKNSEFTSLEEINKMLAVVNNLNSNLLHDLTCLTKKLLENHASQKMPSPEIYMEGINKIVIAIDNLSEKLLKGMSDLSKTLKYRIDGITDAFLEIAKALKDK